MKLRMFLFVTVAVIFATLISGCARPYHLADLRTIEPSQTAYLIPLEGKTSGQAKFDSEKFLESHKVATKRIEIPYRWYPEGYETVAPKGKWIPAARLIIVERKPVTREWTESPTNGTSAKNEGIGAETKESIGFMARMNCSAQIDEPDSSLFLYRYNNKSLEEVMDQDIRPRVEAKFVEECARYTLSEDPDTGILVKKSKIMEAVRKDAIPFFRARGVIITVLGLKGELTYNDPEVQKAISQRFISKQQMSKADNDAIVAKKLKSSGGLDYQLKLQEMEIRRTNAEAALLIAKAINTGKAKLPEVLAGNGTIIGVPLQTLGKP